MRRNTILLLSLFIFALPALGQVDFSKYVALGDSISAGFQSGGLVGTVSRNSFPAILHRQATGVDTGFTQPLVSEPGLPPLLQLNSLAGPVIAPKPGPPGSLTNPLITMPYNNLAVPGAKVRDTVMTSTGGLHDLVLQQFSPVLHGKTALQQALLKAPTFTTIWLGNNDVLSAATSGLVIEGVTLTPVAQFEADYRVVAMAMATTGTKLAFANIPDVTSLPFVTTVPNVVVNPATSQPVIVGGSTVPLIGPNGLLGPGDRVLLTATTELRAGKGIPKALGGTGLPLSDTSVLSAGEIATISARVAAYNTIIATVANERGGALVDVNAILRQAATRGIPIGGITFTPAFLTGGIFSYDGVHPTSFGYAFIANEFVKAINAKFGVSIPQVDFFPFIFGGATTAATAANGALAANDELAAPSFVFTEEAKKSLFWALNVPTAAPAPRPHGGGHHGHHH